MDLSALIERPSFCRYIGVDYSGARTPLASLKGLRVYQAAAGDLPEEVLPPPSPRKYWTRKGLAEWLLETLKDGKPTVVGIDHAFSLPLSYFERHQLILDWPSFLLDFRHHWPTHEDQTSVEFVRKGLRGNGTSRDGNSRWRRVTEVRAGGAKSAFHFDVQGSVAKSTHSGLPWLLYLRENLGGAVHFWPFDGWQVPEDHSVILEVYLRLWKNDFPKGNRTGDQHDAFAVAAWLSQADAAGRLKKALQPDLNATEKARARVEGWILGVK